MRLVWSKTLILFSSICLVLTGAAALVSIAGGHFLPHSAGIAYIQQVQTYAEADIYLIDPDRNLNLNLMTDPANPPAARRAMLYASDNVLVWSPDGNALAYFSRFYTFSLNLVNLRRHLTTLIGDASLLSGLSWSPDGTTLAYSAWYSGGKARSDQDLYTLALRSDQTPAATSSLLYETGRDER
ncbi:MAG TPA: hypothetical protein VHL11_23070, partial [Phototrophicaceae bacterium]|nr:hypothetical protein [Phototrophicaceae bacterium]